MLSLVAAAALFLADWEMIEKQDPMTDVVFYQAHKIGEGGAVGVQCNEFGELSAMFALPRFLGFRSGEEYDFAFRFDDNRSELAQWMYVGNDLLATEGWRAKDFVAGLRLSRRLRVRITRIDGSYHYADIDISGGNAILGELLENCS